MYAGGNGRDKRLEGTGSISLLKVGHRDGGALCVMVVKPRFVVRVGLQISPARPPEFAPIELHPPFAGPECLAPRVDRATPVVHRQAVREVYGGASFRRVLEAGPGRVVSPAVDRDRFVPDNGPQKVEMMDRHVQQEGLVPVAMTGRRLGRGAE